MKKFSLKEEWYFIRQDIVSYLIPTALFLFLNLIQKFTLQTFLYSAFECLTFYISFWFIRINFDNTYHSDSWKHCKFWTRTMLCLGVFVLWMLPIKYTLLNAFTVSLACCLILYMVAIEVDEKKSLLKQREDNNIYTMTEEEFYEYCKSKGINEYDTRLADVIFRKQIKGQELYNKIGYSKIQTLRIRKRLKTKLTT